MKTFCVVFPVNTLVPAKMFISALPALDVSLGILFLAALWRLISRKTPSMPPGPRGLPLLGNVLNMPTTESWLVFAQWAKTYGMSSVEHTRSARLIFELITPGDLMSVTLLGQPIIIVNSQKIARDMLDKKAAIYSDRPYLEMCSNLGQLLNLYAR